MLFLLRKTIFDLQNLSKTWLCLDGPLNAGWADNFNSILNGDRVLHLRNGDKLFLSENIIVVFETTNLSEASPATIDRTVRTIL